SVGDGATDRGCLVERERGCSRVLTRPAFRVVPTVEEQDVVAAGLPDLAGKGPRRREKRHVHFLSARRDRGATVRRDHEFAGRARDAGSSGDPTALVEEREDDERIEDAPGP